MRSGGQVKKTGKRRADDILVSVTQRLWRLCEMIEPHVNHKEAAERKEGHSQNSNFNGNLD